MLLISCAAHEINSMRVRPRIYTRQPQPRCSTALLPAPIFRYGAVIR